MSRFALHPEAFDDLDEIRAWVAEESPDAADRLVNEIFARLGLLAEFPHQGFHRPLLTNLPIRFVVVQHCLIAYAPESHPLWILAVIDGRRNPRTIAAILKERA